MQRLLCLRCGDSIHPDTAARNEGLCMPCVRGNQLTIEQRREAQAAEKAWRESPSYLYWGTLVDRVYKREGFDALPPGDRLYFLINVLGGEVHNGGFDQFFSNTSGDRFHETVEALKALGLDATLGLLMEGKAVVFGDQDVPADRKARFALMVTSDEDHPRHDAAQAALDALDQRFYEAPDEIEPALTRLAHEFKLYGVDEAERDENDR